MTFQHQATQTGVGAAMNLRLILLLLLLLLNGCLGCLRRHNKRQRLMHFLASRALKSLPPNVLSETLPTSGG